MMIRDFVCRARIAREATALAAHLLLRESVEVAAVHRSVAIAVAIRLRRTVSHVLRSALLEAADAPMAAAADDDDATSGSDSEARPMAEQ
jgi:hypothetical protein